MCVCEVLGCVHALVCSDFLWGLEGGYEGKDLASELSPVQMERKCQGEREGDGLLLAPLW